MKSYIKATGLLIILIFLVTFGIKNDHLIQLYYYFNYNSTEFPLYLLAYACIVIGIFVRGSALLIGVMLVVFIIALSSALVRGLDISCGCFTLEGGRKIAVTTLVEDILLLAGAAIALFYGTRAFAIRRRVN